jgi:ANTAR domain
VTSADLAQDAASLLRLSGESQPRSLNHLAALAARTVPACAGATATLWRDREPLLMAATHPDLPFLISIQVSSGRGPVIDALASTEPVSTTDTLAETRWPEFAAQALRCGVRSCVTFAYPSGAEAVTLSLYGARPRALAADHLQLAELLIAFGGAALGNAARYGDARMAARQMLEGAESRALVDQAKGMLMQAFGCSADSALARMRRISQERNLKVTEVARKVVDGRGTVARL